MTSPFRMNQMMIEVRRRTMPVCKCGHLLTEHDAAGACNEPTGRCLCGEATDLCPTCRHTLDKFDADLGACTAVNPGAQHRCGCTQSSADITNSGTDETAGSP